MKSLPRKILLPLTFTLTGFFALHFSERSDKIYFGPIETIAEPPTHLLVEANIFLTSHNKIRMTTESKGLEIGSFSIDVHTNGTTSSTFFFPLFEGPVDTIRLQTSDISSKARLDILRITDRYGKILREIDHDTIKQLNATSSSEFIIPIAEPLEITPRRLDGRQDLIGIGLLFGRLFLFPGLLLVALTLTLDRSLWRGTVALSMGLSILLAAVGALRMWRALDHPDLSRAVSWQEIIGGRQDQF